MSSAGDAPRGGRADAFRLVGTIVAVMWIVEVIDSLDHHDLDRHGIVPRHLSGLAGIVFAPFLHASFGHLIANTVPFVVLGLTIAVGGLAQFASVTAIVAAVSGLGTWLIAPSSSVTVGASGIVFGYATYLIARGVFNGSLSQLAIGAVVGVLFGGALLWDLVPHAGISWQDHLFGAIGGVLAARFLAPSGPQARAAPTPTVGSS